MACQATNDILKLSNGLDVKVITAVGGTRLQDTLQQLKDPFNVIIGTPGRLVDLINMNSLTLEDVNFVGLEDYDRIRMIGLETMISEIFNSLSIHTRLLISSSSLDFLDWNSLKKYVSSPSDFEILKTY